MVGSSRDKVGVRGNCGHEQGCVKGARHTQVISPHLAVAPREVSLLLTQSRQET